MPKREDIVVSRPRNNNKYNGIHFHEIYCINLKKRRDRWRRVQKEFSKVKMLGNLIRFDALETPKDGRIGCAKSHLMLLKLARDKKMDQILIFEDDMKWVMKNVCFLIDDLEKLSKIKWDIFYLGCQFIRNDLPFLIEEKGLLRMGGGRGTHAIVYNHSCYEFLIRELQMIDDNCEKFIRTFGAIDVYIEKVLHPRLQVYMVNNVICEQYADFSDTSNKIENYHNMIVKNFYALKGRKRSYQLKNMFLRKLLGILWRIHHLYLISPLRCLEKQAIKLVFGSQNLRKF